MTWLAWVGAHWFDGLQTVAIVSGLVFTALGWKRDENSREVANLFLLTSNHRDIWEKLMDHPELFRVLDPEADLAAQPVTQKEALFVRFVILHVYTAYRASLTGTLEPLQHLGEDIKMFLSAPVPHAVWEQARVLQDADYVEFVEKHLANRKS